MKTMTFLLTAIFVSASAGITTQANGATSDLLSKKLGLFVFPTDNQTNEQQEMDEYNCYKWAVE